MIHPGAGSILGWAHRGQRVLLVDLDPKNTATMTLDVWGVEPGNDAVWASLAGAIHKLEDLWHIDELPASQSLATWDTDPGDGSGSGSDDDPP